jgi:hypothetical protein
MRSFVLYESRLIQVKVHVTLTVLYCVFITFGGLKILNTLLWLDYCLLNKG